MQKREIGGEDKPYHLRERERERESTFVINAGLVQEMSLILQNASH